MSGNSKVVCKNCGKEEIVFNSRANSYVYCSMNCVSKGYFKSKLKIEDTVNNWKISKEPFRKHGRSYVEVTCTCGSGIKKVYQSKRVLAKTLTGCGECSQPYGAEGYGQVSAENWWKIKHGASKRNLELDVDSKYLWELFLKQNRKCNLSGVDLIFCNKRERRGNTTASLDRIDSSLGYLKGNVQWIHKDLNYMKHAYKQDYFIQMCKLVSNFNEREKMLVKLIKNKDTPIPHKAHKSDACYDVYATSVKDLGDGRIEYGLGICLQPTELASGIQFDFRARSSIHKTGLILSNCIGTGDEGYTGEYKAVFYNIIPNLPNYKVGDRILQMQCTRPIDIEFIEVKEFENTERGTGGFGSTNV